MLPVFADPKTHVIFYRIFGVPERKHLFIALLDDLLELDGDRRIQDLQLLEFVQSVNVHELRRSFLDYTCTDASGRRFIVKIQSLIVEEMEKALIYDPSKPYLRQPKIPGEPLPFCDVVGLTLANFNFWPPDTDHEPVPMLSHWRRPAPDSPEQRLSQVRYTFLELPKYEAGEHPRTSIERWAYFFCEVKNLNAVPAALSEGLFREALEPTRRVSFSFWDWEIYERAKMAEQDMRGAVALARREGYELGFALSTKSALLRLLLQTAGIPLTEAEDHRIESCEDPATLDRWLKNVLSAKTAAEVLT